MGFSLKKAFKKGVGGVVGIVAAGGGKKDVGQFLSAAGTVISFVPGFQVLGAALLVTGGVLQASAAKDAAKKAARRAEAEAARGRAVTGTVASGDEAHNIVFGTARVGGVVLNTGTSGLSNTVLEIFVAHCITHAGGIQGVPGLYLSEKKIPLAAASVITVNAGTGTATKTVTNTPASGDTVGMLLAKTYFGLHTQNIQSQDTASTVAVATDHGKGVCWTRFQFTRDLNNDPAFQRAFGGIPQPSAEVQGWLCYDPRLDTTRGGAGSHRADQPLTWTFSDNVALVGLTYLLVRGLDGSCGIGTDEVDYAAFAAAATACDPLIGPVGQQVPKFRFNGVLSTADGCDVNLERIAACMAGSFWQENGVWKARAGTSQSPTAVITDDWLAGGIQVVNGTGLDGLYNAVRVVYSSPANGYMATEAYPFTNEAYEAEDGGRRLFRDLNLSCVTNEYQAQYLGQIEGRRSRHQRRVTATLNLRGLDLTSGQKVTLNFSAVPEICGANEYLVEAKGYDIGDDGAVLVSVLLIEDRSDTYTVGAFGTPSITPAYPDLYETPAVPTAFTALGVTDGINLAWRSPSATTHTGIDIEVASAVGGPYTVTGTLKGDGAVYGNTSGSTLFFRIRARNLQGQVSAYAGPVSAKAKTSADGATAGARLGGTLYQADGTTIVSNVDGIPDGTTYGRTNNDILTGNRPDLSKPLVNRLIDHLADTLNFRRTRPRRVDANSDPYIDLGESINLNRTAAFISETATQRWAGETGADISSNNVSAPLFNPGFEAGDKSWTKQAGWTIVNDAANARTGNWVGVFTGGTTTIKNNQRIPVTGGQVVVGQAWLKAAAGSNGTGNVRVNFLNAAGVEIQNINGNVLSPSTSYGASRVTAVARGDAVSAYVDVLVSGRTAGTWYADDVTAALQLHDQRTSPALATGGLRSRWSGQTISASYSTASPAAVTFSISAASLLIGDVTISYAALSNSNTQARGTTVLYYLYFDDPTYAGGAQTLVSDTNGANLYVTNGRIYAGSVSVTVPPAATGGTSPGDGGGGSCVAIEMLDPEGRCFGELVVGDTLILADEATLAPGVGAIERIHTDREPCLRLLTANGAALVCSLSAPIAVEGRGCVAAGDLVEGDTLGTLVDDVAGWSPLVAIEPAGLRLVRPLYVRDRCFWAGESARASILHHNAKNIP